MPSATALTLTIRAPQRHSTPDRPAGPELAREPLEDSGDFFGGQPDNTGALTVERQGDLLQFSSGDLSGAFDLKQGRLTAYRQKGVDLIRRGLDFANFPEPYFWRAPTDNDFGANFQNYARVWTSAHTNRQLKKVEAGSKTSEGQPITVLYRLPDVRGNYTLQYLIQNDGAVQINATLELPSDSEAPELPRMGLRFMLPAACNQLSWYGRGPWENYSDRNTAAFLGLWEDHTDNGWTRNYVRPQESGYKTDARWIRLTDAEGFGLEVRGLQPLCFSAMPQLSEDFDEGTIKRNRHTTDIVKRPFVCLHVDLAQRGVGGDNSWGAQPHDEYRLFGKKYAYGFVIKALRQDRE